MIIKDYQWNFQNSLDIFQERLSGLIDNLDYVRAYINDLLSIFKRNWKDHLEKVEADLSKLQKAGFQTNAKIIFGTPIDKVEFLRPFLILSAQFYLRIFFDLQKFRHVDFFRLPVPCLAFLRLPWVDGFRITNLSMGLLTLKLPVQNKKLEKKGC